VITILTGGRPVLLADTVGSLAAKAPEFVESARVVALVNGKDDRAAKILGDLGWVDTILRHSGPMLPIGAAISRLMGAAEIGDADTLFHLEDDWRCVNSGWLQKAEWILKRHPKVGQVRLRKWLPTSTPGAVSRYHMVTRKVLDWKKHRSTSPPPFRYMVDRAHFTFNPTLTRGRAVKRIYPCTSELDAASHYHATKLLAAQLLPGSFSHTGGDGRSMRAKTGSR
jgi:hypothetical protein